MNKVILSVLFCFTVSMVASQSLLGQTAGSVEDVQIRSIDFETQVLELHNFGGVDRPLDGWRFCSHDEVDGFDYTSTNGLNGITLAPGASLFVHWLNDAVAGNEVDISGLGGNSIDDLLTNTSGSAISIGIYRDGSFGSATSLVDHVQYSFNGANVPSATPRSGPAVNAELWTGASDWITITADATGIVLSADPFPGSGNSHGPGSYDVIVPTTSVITADTLTLNAGELASGSVANLSASDDSDLSTRRSPLSLQPVVEFEIEGESPSETPTGLEFTFEGSVFARSAVTQTISLFDFDAGSFEEIDSRAASRFVDATVTVTLVGSDFSRFVEPGTNHVRARIRYRAGAARLQYSVNSDFAAWSITH